MRDFWALRRRQALVKNLRLRRNRIKATHPHVAFLVNSPNYKRGLILSVKDRMAIIGMGRVQAHSMRTRIHDQMKHLKKRFRAALKDDELQEAFDDFWPTWSSEMATMIFAEVLSALDLLLLTSEIDNRREIRKLKERIE